MPIAQSASFRSLFVGIDTQVPLLDGTHKPYVNLDNAASTPALKRVQAAVDNFLPYYSSVHRGTGYKSQISTYLYEEARHLVMEFVGADTQEHVCIFGKNTTEAVNKLARRFPFPPGRDVVLVSHMEHHSNDLPWRKAATIIRIGLNPDGSLDESDFDRLVTLYKDRLALVSITGASNVTGFINPVHRLAEKTHGVGAQIAVDCAQLAPHRSVHMLPLSDPAHLDYVFLSAHKMYAPFGTGALVGRRDTFAQGEPDMQGGGEVEIVTLDQVTWSDPPERDEAGSPNTVGAIAFAAAISQLSEIGMEQVAAHEAELTAYALEKLSQIPGLTIYGSSDPAQAANRLGVIPINLNGFSHYLLAAILGYEFGIGVRNGCFCAHPYLLFLMGVEESNADRVRELILKDDRREVPGMVRISFGLYNEKEDIDSLITAIKAIQAHEYK
ncbi:MAG TPA: aminotransferase class V-fold PLP-dependent enzyme, partial [Longilinea sp.]|nr:aminotransferase class V-fold PLP-dependent enzyme [Longilinea sp.]